MRDDRLYTFGHNFVIICPIFKLFFFKFSERLALSFGGVGVHEGTASYPSSRDKRARVNDVLLYYIWVYTVLQNTYIMAVLCHRQA